MTSRMKALGAVAVVAVAALVPLYGDPRSTPVTHAEWARMLLRALEMEDVLPVSETASQAFTTLSWKNSLAFRADRYIRASGVQVMDAPRRVLALQGQGDVVYPLAVVRGGDYRLRVRIAGNPAVPASAEIRTLGAALPAKTFTIVPHSVSGWIDAGTAHLDPGAYTASVLLPAGTALENVEVSPPCIAAIEPEGGWKATAIVQTGDIAVTAIKALDKESELPAAAPPVDIYASDFQVSPGSGVVATASRAGGREGLWLKAGPLGLQAIVFVDLPEAGLYSVSSFGVEGGGQGWVADACRKAVLCGGADLAGTRDPEWRKILTADFAAGRHFFTVTLGPGAAVERVRLERKKNTQADYLDTLRRLGFDPGATGPVARNKAVEAMNFIRSRRTEVLAKPCGDIVVAENGPGSAGGQSEPTSPVAGPPPPPLNSGMGQPPLGPPPVPPQDPASPVAPGL